MAKHHPLDFSRKQLLDYAGGGGIGKMTVPRHDPLFHRPGAMRIVLQKFFVMIRFDHEGMHFAQTFDQHLRRVTKIGDEAEPAIAGVKSITDRLDRVVRDGEVCTRMSQMVNSAPVRKMRQFRCSPTNAIAADSFRRLGVAINRDGEFAAKHFEAANMIAVLVGEKDAIELVGATPHCSSRVTIWRALNPPSMRMRQCAVATRAQLPALPLPSMVRLNTRMFSGKNIFQKEERRKEIQILRAEFLAS